jgi:hypothetical protein
VEDDFIDFEVAFDKFKSVGLHDKQLGILGSFSAFDWGQENQIARPFGHLLTSISSANKS